MKIIIKDLNDINPNCEKGLAFDINGYYIKKAGTVKESIKQTIKLLKNRSYYNKKRGLCNLSEEKEIEFLKKVLKTL